MLWNCSLIEKKIVNKGQTYLKELYNQSGMENELKKRLVNQSKVPDEENSYKKWDPSNLGAF